MAEPSSSTIGDPLMPPRMFSASEIHARGVAGADGQGCGKPAQIMGMSEDEGVIYIMRVIGLNNDNV
jgi:hypothetical protein